MVDRAKKITELPGVAAITNNDLFIVVTNTAGTAVTKQITINNFRAGLPPVVVGIANTTHTGVVAIGDSLSANDTGWLTLAEEITVSNVVTGTLRANSTAEFTANVYLGLIDGEAEAQLIHMHGTLHSNVVPHTPDNYQLGNTSNYFHSLDVKTVNFADSTSMNTAFKWVAAPALANSTGTAGSIAYDSGYVYICVATNTWKRAALTSW